MGKIAKKLLILTAVFSLCAVSVTGCGKAKDTDVVAKVGDQEIPYGVANFYARMQQAQMESYYTAYGQDVDTLWAQELKDGDTYEESYRKSIMETLENFYLMEMHMEDYGVTITEEDKQKIEEAAEQFLSSNSDESKDVVSGKKEYVTRVLELMTIASRMEEPMKAEADVNVTDEEAAQKSMQYVLFSYSTQDESGNNVDMTDEEKAAQKEKAQNFLDQLKANEFEDFETYAGSAGLEVQTATFDSESTSPAEEVVKAADALQAEGDVSDVIETDGGCYVVKLTSLMDREATDNKKAELVSQKKTDKYNELLKEWRSDAKVKEYKSVWKKLDFVNQGIKVKQKTEDAQTNDDAQTGEDTQTGDDTQADGDTQITGGDDTNE